MLREREDDRVHRSELVDLTDEFADLITERAPDEPETTVALELSLQRVRRGDSAGTLNFDSAI